MAEAKTKAVTKQAARKLWPAEMMWKLEDIIPYPKNTRTHPPEQIDLLAELLKKFGADQPIVVDEDRVILKGHGRRLGAFKAEMTEFPVVQRFGLSEDDKEALRIADNQSALMSGWDQELMKVAVGNLAAKGYNVALLGFPPRELTQWTRQNYETAPDTLPTPIKHPAVRTGDLWLLDKHCLLCGDSTDAKNVQKVLAGGKAIFFGDPPYGIEYEYNEHKDGKDSNADLVRAVLANCPEAKVYTPGKMNLARELAVYPDAKVLCWHKKFAQAGSGLGGASTWEPVIVVGIKGAGAHLPDDYLPFPTDREASPLDPDKMLRDEHSCPKPVALFEHLIASLAGDDTIAFDPFTGSGTTLIAAQLAGRRFAGIEKDPKYVELTIIRWQQFTGGTAKLAGKTLEQVRAQRRKKPRALRPGATSGAPARA